MTGASAAKPLDGKIALVTGAGRGIGRGIAAALVEAGATVIAVARTGADLASLQEELSVSGAGKLDCWSEDVASDAFIARVTGLDRLDILVNNAGANRPQPMIEVTDETLDFLLMLNVRAVYRTARAAARVMLRHGAAGSGGVIINMSSQMGHVGSPGRTVYCMTKHAVEGLTKAMAVELATHKIRVNSVAPTFVETALTAPMLEDAEFRAFVDRMIPLGRLALAGDVASGVVFLASPAAAMITGHSLVIDGGWTAQ